MRAFFAKSFPLAIALMLASAKTGLGQETQLSFPGTTSQSTRGASKIIPGQDAEEILDTLGEPDRKSTNSSELEFWYYGSSIIIIAAGKVQAVNDAGELGKRKKKPETPQTRQTPTPPPKDSLWPNPWSPPDNLKADDIVDLFKEP